MYDFEQIHEVRILTHYKFMWCVVVSRLFACSPALLTIIVLRHSHKGHVTRARAALSPPGVSLVGRLFPFLSVPYFLGDHKYLRAKLNMAKHNASQGSYNNENSSTMLQDTVGYKWNRLLWAELTVTELMKIRQLIVSA